MLHTFKNVHIRLIVGIGGGVPSAKNDIRLGDVVVSSPTGPYGGVIQHDLGKHVGHKILITGSLSKPSQSLLIAVARLRTEHLIAADHKVSHYVEEMLTKNSTMRTAFACPSLDQDQLFEAEYEHVESSDTCAVCDQSRTITRSSRSPGPEIHYGLIASGNQVMRHGLTRDRLSEGLGILCFEMEAAGLMDNFSCLVVRGICDYADSQKNKDWQGYAAATAAG
jgi:nucleoside phosphorylase